MRSFWRKRTSTSQRALAVKAIGGVGIEFQMKAQLDDQQGMFEQKATQLARVAHLFPNAYEKGFEIGAFGMGRPSTSRTLGLPLVNERPIQQGEKGAIVLHHGINVEHLLQHRLVKEARREYQTG